MKGPAYDLAGTRLEAISIGGLETCLHFPEWKLALDIGRSPEWVVKRDRVFFTHAHVDHLAGVAYHAATRSMRGMPVPHYWMPAENVSAFGAMMRAWEPLDGSELAHVAHGLVPGDEVELEAGRFVRAIRAYHNVPALGYVLGERRQKLCSEFLDLPADEIVKRRVAGEVLTEPVELIAAAYAGDTLIDALDREPDLCSARLLILECTFVDDRISVAECRSRGHVHLDEIVERADLFQNEAIALMHFSARYSPGEIRRALDERLPSNLRHRVTPLL
ncbi:MAG: MBL fold metallo-hydrolase [Planctomycetota bacterium]